jgi:HK97 family phage portal protein
MAERRLRLFGRKTKAAGLVTATPPLMEVLRLLDGSAASYGQVYRQIAPVRTVVDFISDAVATTPLKVYRRQENGRPEARNHGLAVLLRNPNPDMSTRRLIWRTIADLAIYGNAYWRKVQEGTNKFLVPLPPHRVTPRGGDLLKAAAFDFFSPTGLTPQRFSADEIVHFVLYDPEDPRIGSSKLQALRNILLEEVEASKHRRGYWQNHARLEGILQHPEQLSFEAQERLRTQFDNTYAGSDNSGRTAVLEEGMTWQKISDSPKDSEFVQGRQFVLEATARAYNVPLPLLSLTDTATYASQREFHKQLYTEALPPWYELIQSEIELQVLPWFVDQDVYVEFVVESKLRGDFIDRAQVLNTAVGRPWMTVVEARNVENMDNRHVPEDSELVVPVGPNFALEGMAVAAPAQQPQPVLAPVAALPAGKSALGAFFARQERSVVPRLAAGHEKAFDRERWDRELAGLVGPERAAEINLRTQVLLMTGTDPREVFAELKQVEVA